MEMRHKFEIVAKRGTDKNREKVLITYIYYNQHYAHDWSG